jgi:hypothetical protein
MFGHFSRHYEEATKAGRMTTGRSCPQTSEVRVMNGNEKK